MAWNMGMLGGTMKKLPLQFIASGLGSGYGSAITSLEGNSYVQSYGTLYKLNKNGILQWGRQLSGSGNKYGVTLDDSENVYTCGTNSSVAKFDSSGNLLWQKEIGTGITWQSCRYMGGQLWLAGNNGSYGHFAQLLPATGAVIFGKRTTANVEFQDICATSNDIGVTGYLSNGTNFESVYLNLNYSSKAIEFQKRFYISGSNVFIDSLDISSGTNYPLVAGFIQGNEKVFVIQLNASGTTLGSLRSASVTGGYLYDSYGTAKYSGSGKIYLSSYNIQNNYGPTVWGAGYTRFSSSLAREKTITFSSAGGALRIQASGSEDTIGIMGTQKFVKVDGIATPLGTFGTTTVYEDPTDYTFSTGAISISNSSIALVDSGVVSNSSSYSVVSAGSQPTLTYLI